MVMPVRGVRALDMVLVAVGFRTAARHPAIASDSRAQAFRTS